MYQVSYFLRDAPDKLYIPTIKKGSIYLITGDRVMVLAFHSAISFIALYYCIKFHLFIFNTFRDMLRTSLLLQKLKENNCEITCDRLTVLALCTFSDGRLSKFKVSIYPILHFQRYASSNF